MRSLTHLLSRANTPPDANEVALVPGDAPTFMDIAERVGSDNETLRNLLTDIDLQFGAIENLKSAFAKIVQPLNNLAKTLSDTKLEDARLRQSLEDLHASHEALSAHHQTLEQKYLQLRADSQRLSQDLNSSEQARRALEGDKATLSEQVATLCANLTTVETALRERATEARELAEEKKMLLDRLGVFDRRIIELEVAGASEHERASLLESERASLQGSLGETLERVSQLTRQISNFEKLLSEAAARVEQLTRSSTLLEQERDRLTTACEEANHRREAEVQSLTTELSTARSRSAAAEKQCVELRQAIAVQAEERKSAETKLAAITITLSKNEERAASLSTALEESENRIKDLERSYSSLTESHRALSKTASMREAALEEARKKIKALTQHVDLIKADAAANREAAENLIQDLKGEIESLRTERAVTKGALEATRTELVRLQREIAAPQRQPRSDTPDEPMGDIEAAG